MTTGSKDEVRNTKLKDSSSTESTIISVLSQFWTQTTSFYPFFIVSPRNSPFRKVVNSYTSPTLFLIISKHSSISPSVIVKGGANLTMFPCVGFANSPFSFILRHKSQAFPSLL